MAEQVVQSIVDWIYLIPPFGIYLIFIAIAYIENVLPPLPGDVLLAFGGYLAADGSLSLPVLWIITVLASVVGFMNMYWIGNKLGGHVEENKETHFLLRFINYKYFEKGKKWMGKYGQWVIFGNRFLAGTRSVISLTAGMSHLNLRFTILNSFISSALWNALLLLAGWFVRDNWKVIGGYLSTYGKVILLCIGITILARFLWVKFGRKISSENEVEE
ncbi:MAG: DedA family protein [Balneola sp.]|nr:MAG: DedA family protein [Balneola sp.]